MEVLDARYVADCIIGIAAQNPDINDITNLKLQKLLYYAQGTFLALHGQKLFEQPIMKWQYGPVVPDVYHQYKYFGNNVIEGIDVDTQYLHPEQMRLLHMVYDYFGQFSAIKLMNLTHSESPWNSVEMGEEIPDNLLIEFFNTIVVKDGQQ